MLRRVGCLLPLFAFCGAAFAAAPPCEPAPFLARVPFLAEQMSSTTAPDGRLVFSLRNDPRIQASFRTAAAAPLASTTRLGFAAEVGRRLAPEAGAVKARGGQMLVAAIPFPPAAYRVVRRGDPEIGTDRIAGRLTVYVSPTCELVADYAAPDAMLLRAQFGEVVAAVDAVRDVVGRLAPSVPLHDESNAPVGGLAYLVGLGLPAVVAVILTFLLSRSVAKGAPGALSKAAMIFVGATSGLVVAGSKYAGFPTALPPEILALVAAVSAAGVVTAFLPAGVPLRFAIAFGCAAGFSIVGYALLGWVAEPYGISLAGACISLGSILAALWWTRATGRFLMPIL
ncbi:hypothetical protein MexAM1_META2p0583 (plasmid) [Methylorubrum extorquens AM1]|uniref:Uncharacterized protein n=2 Tax=Methylorubrum extorquens TaxID=408 RepID=C5B4P8_METEA|nr:hypothetical protein MexAM1_META2p0583 [Methylorubrum extorquens AM1]